MQAVCTCLSLYEGLCLQLFFIGYFLRFSNCPILTHVVAVGFPNVDVALARSKYTI